MNRALVTGATGFLGGALARGLLAAGWAVEVVHRRSSSSAAALDELAALGAGIHIYDDVREARDLAAALAPVTAFHLATHYVRDHAASDVGPLITANVEFGTHLLDGLVDSDSTVVAAMSFFQYRGGRPATNSLYSATKQAFSDILAFYGERRGLATREVVIYDTFGPGDTRDKLVPLLFESAREGTPRTLGNPDQLIDLSFVDDVVAGFLAAAAPESPGRVALRAPAPVRVADLVDAVAEATGRPIHAAFDPSRPVNGLLEVAGDWPAPPDWAPQTTLAEGLRRIAAAG